MRVLIDTSYAARGPSGTGVYIEELVAALKARDDLEVIEAAQPRRGARGAGNPLRSGVNLARDLWWLHVGLPRVVRRSGADVVHHPLPAHSRAIHAAQVATIHDVAFELFPDTYGRVWRWVAGRAYRRAAGRCGAIVCVSEQTAADVVELLGAPPKRIVVAHHGPGQAEGVNLRERPRTHLLYVGDVEGRKGVAFLLDAYDRYREEAANPLDLVLVGAAAGLADPGEPGLRGVPRASREELLELYASAVALVHPSAHEGFGLTILEAMALGTPVLAIRTPGGGEVAGDAALVVKEPADLVAAMVRITSDRELQKRLSAAGSERAAQFSWAASARSHERAYTLARR